MVNSLTLDIERQLSGVKENIWNRSGVINIYTEAGYTSHDVVAKLRGILKQKRSVIREPGSSGTGCPAVCLGKGTKLCDLLADHDKEYEAVLRLGITTDTQDMEGTILKESSVQVSARRSPHLHSFISG